MIFRLKIIARGTVQGVGFRPFIYRLAHRMHLNGYILNSATGVIIEVEGEKSILDQFLLRLEAEKPCNAVIHSREFSFLDPLGFADFEIRQSENNKDISAVILPDIAVCKDCLREMYNPRDRRYLYPFTNCTNCGPRFSIMEALPYDRSNTSMKIFEMCEDCRREYENPLDRRFHAQPVACPVCGPHLELWDGNGKGLLTHHEALLATADKIRQGNIIALKGLGGFQLIVDATNTHAVERLRLRKHREEKPLALMFPSLSRIKEICNVSDFEDRLLQSPESPIVLLKKKDPQNASSPIPCGTIAPHNPYLGVMIPYTPLHHLLLRALDFPVTATSGNISEEPMCIDEYKALQKLSGIADYFLIHNRPIARHVDDSIVRVIMGREMVLRRARGYAPLPVQIAGLDRKSQKDLEPVLAVGGHLKNTIAIGKDGNIFLSQHIGDLSTAESLNAFREVIYDLTVLYKIAPKKVISDLHPDYLSTKYAKDNYLETIGVQHHEAHIAACRAENQITGKALGVSWDGTGYGWDGSMWGGEFFISDDSSYIHVVQLRKFPLPGGDKAIKEPRRSALGILFEIFGTSVFKNREPILDKFSLPEQSIIKQMLEKKIYCPLTSSAGRLFDAVASLLNLCHKNNYEGQAAMMLEFIADIRERGRYEFELIDKNPVVINWQPILEQILQDIKNLILPEKISMRFHNTLAEIILKVSQHFGIEKVLFSGGCFQNAILLEEAAKRLRESGFRVYWHQRIPPNDGGIALGQIIRG